MVSFPFVIYNLLAGITHSHTHEKAILGNRNANLELIALSMHLPLLVGLLFKIKLPKSVSLSTFPLELPVVPAALLRSSPLTPSPLHCKNLIQSSFFDLRIYKTPLKRNLFFKQVNKNIFSLKSQTLL